MCSAFRQSNRAGKFRNGLLAVSGKNFDVDVAFFHRSDQFVRTVSGVIVNERCEGNAHTIFHQEAGTMPIGFGCLVGVEQPVFNRDAHGCCFVGPDDGHLRCSMLA